jgi:hypothetical protein
VAHTSYIALRISYWPFLCKDKLSIINQVHRPGCAMLPGMMSLRSSAPRVHADKGGRISRDNIRSIHPSSGPARVHVRQ